MAAAAPRQLRIAFGGQCLPDQGAARRGSFAVLQPASLRLRDSKGCVACLASGPRSGGNDGLAGRISVSAFIEDYFSTPARWDVKTSAARVLAALNDWLHRQGQPGLGRQDALVTAFAALVLRSGGLHLFLAGGCRAQLWRQGQLLPLDPDPGQSSAGEAESELLTRGLGLQAQLTLDYLQKELQAGDLLLLGTEDLGRSLGREGLTRELSRLETWTDDGQGGRCCELEAAAGRISAAAAPASGSAPPPCLLLRVLELPAESLADARRRSSALAFPPPLEPGDCLDDCRVLRVLDGGPGATRYLAHSPRFAEPVALKLPDPGRADDPRYVEAFIREQWIGAQALHPSLPRVLAAAPDRHFLYQIREHVEGGSLRQWLRDHPQPSLAQLRELVGQIASALRALQRAGLLHADLRPDTVLVSRCGYIQLSELGGVHGPDQVEPAWRGEDAAASLDYRAPECVLGEKGSHRSAIFALGVISYELLTGELPFRRPAAPGHWPRHYEQWRYRPARQRRRDLPIWVDLALEKACAARPAQRYDSLSEFLRDLEQPNRELLERFERAPLLERAPLRVWQGLCALLSLLLLGQVLL